MGEEEKVAASPKFDSTPKKGSARPDFFKTFKKLISITKIKMYGTRKNGVSFVNFGMKILFE